MITFEKYNELSSRVLIYPRDIAPLYLALGVNGESGELGEKIKKVYRDNAGLFEAEHIESIKKEVGDVLWYLNRLSEELGFTLEEAAELNIEKLKDRIEREVIQSSGDNR